MLRVESQYVVKSTSQSFGSPNSGGYQNYSSKNGEPPGYSLLYFFNSCMSCRHHSNNLTFFISSTGVTQCMECHDLDTIKQSPF